MWFLYFKIWYKLCKTLIQPSLGVVWGQLGFFNNKRRDHSPTPPQSTIYRLTSTTPHTHDNQKEKVEIKYIRDFFIIKLPQVTF